MQVFIAMDLGLIPGQGTKIPQSLVAWSKKKKKKCRMPWQCYRNSKTIPNLSRSALLGHLPACLNYTFLGRILQFTQTPFTVALTLICLFRLDQVQLVFISSIFNGKYYWAFTKCLAVYIPISHVSSSSVRYIGKVTKHRQETEPVIWVRNLVKPLTGCVSINKSLIL